MKHLTDIDTVRPGLLSRLSTPKWLSFFLTLLMGGIGAAVVIIVFSSRGPKIGYIRSEVLVYSYSGMTEAHDKFSAHQKQWQFGIDSLQDRFKSEVSQFRNVMNTLPSTDREKKQQQLAEEQKGIQQRIAELNKQAQEEDTRMTQGVLAQINSLVAEYGRKHGYDIILGTTQSGSVLYGQPDLDITNDVLKALNSQYKPGNSQ